LKQLAAGEYQPIPVSTDLRSLAADGWSKMLNLTVHIDESVPAFVVLSTELLKIIMSNSMHNAVQHGKRGGAITLHVGTRQGRLTFALQNEAGSNHSEALRMQGEHGVNMLLEGDCGALDRSSIGSSMSTFMGMSEMQDAAEALNAVIKLTFYAAESSSASAHVIFLLDIGLIEGAPPAQDESLTLRQGSILICADDDFAPRLQYKSMAKKLGVPASNTTILGETFSEVQSLVATVLESAEEHGAENVVCIFDQNMDRYQEGRELGTNLTRELRERGFRGLIFIRSANDDPSSGSFYRSAGVNACLGKTEKASTLIETLVAQCELAWALGVCAAE
jgi:hypothetical protein